MVFAVDLLHGKLGFSLGKLCLTCGKLRLCRRHLRFSDGFLGVERNLCGVLFGFGGNAAHDVFHRVLDGFRRRVGRGCRFVQRLLLLGKLTVEAVFCAVKLLLSRSELFSARCDLRLSRGNSLVIGLLAFRKRGFTACDLLLRFTQLCLSLAELAVIERFA